MEITIRRACEGDFCNVLRLLKQIAALHEAGRPDVFREGAAKYDAGEFERLLRLPDAPIFVAEADGAFAGYVFCQLKIRENHPLLRDMRTLYIDDLCVDESMRGMGVGTKLMDAAKAFAVENGCHNLDLNVWEFNAAAMKFYERYGLHTFRRYMEIILD